MGPEQARANGLGSTVVFPVGNIAPQGSVVKATAIDPGVISPDNVYRKRGTVRIFTSEKDAVAAVKGTTATPVEPGNVIVLIGIGPLGTGMEETYQLPSALKYIPWGKHVPVITDGRFSGVSTGACIGHVGPEALAGGPVGKLREGYGIDIVIDRNTLEGRINLVAADGCDLSPPEADHLPANTAPSPAHA
jgi:dihydroxyacid dehydratase/phosphogluconate dehydratase